MRNNTISLITFSEYRNFSHTTPSTILYTMRPQHFSQDKDPHGSIQALRSWVFKSFPLYTICYKAQACLQCTIMKKIQSHAELQGQFETKSTEACSQICQHQAAKQKHYNVNIKIMHIIRSASRTSKLYHRGKRYLWFVFTKDQELSNHLLDIEMSKEIMKELLHAFSHTRNSRMSGISSIFKQVFDGQIFDGLDLGWLFISSFIFKAVYLKCTISLFSNGQIFNILKHLSVPYVLKILKF